MWQIKWTDESEWRDAPYLTDAFMQNPRGSALLVSTEGSYLNYRRRPAIGETWTGFYANVEIQSIYELDGLFYVRAADHLWHMDDFIKDYRKV